jgi:hypothetical protein
LVTNRESATTRYRLDYVTGTRVIEYKLSLHSGESFRQVQQVGEGVASAWLYRGSSKTAYRHVWIGVPQG